MSPGCKNCYAETFAERFRGVPGHPYEHGFDLRLVPEKLTEPLRWKKPRRVFVNSMSDLFQDGVPFPFIAAVFAVMAYCDRHTFQVLTKRADRMREFMAWVDAPEGAERIDELYGDRAGQSVTLARMHRVDESIAFAVWGDHDDGINLDACLHNDGVWPPKNVWLGVSVENQHFADERIPLLLQTPAAVRFISAEPLLGPVDLDRGGFTLLEPIKSPSGTLWPGLDWVIVGGESGPGARPFDVAWARSLLAQCRAGGVPCFVKQLGSKVSVNGVRQSLHKKGGQMAEWPEDLRVREFPS